LLLVVIDCFFCKPVWTLCLMSVLWWIFMSYFLKLSKSGMQQCHLQFLLCCWMVAVFCPSWLVLLTEHLCAFDGCVPIGTVIVQYSYGSFGCWSLPCCCILQFGLSIHLLPSLSSLSHFVSRVSSYSVPFFCPLLRHLPFCIISFSFLLKELAGCGHFTDGVPLLVVHIELFVCLSCIGLYVKNMDLYQRCTVIRTYLQCTLTHTLFYHVLLFSLSSI